MKYKPVNETEERKEQRLKKLCILREYRWEGSPMKMYSIIFLGVAMKTTCLRSEALLFAKRYGYTVWKEEVKTFQNVRTFA